MKTLKRICDKYLEDPENPVLGPSLKALFVIGLWQTGGRILTIIMNCGAAFAVVLFVFQIIKLYLVREDMTLVTENLCISGLGAVNYCKAISFIYGQNYWRRLIKGVAEEELLEKKCSNKATRRITEDYTRYSRITYFGYAAMTSGAMVCLIAKPLLLMWIYSDKYDDPKEPLPQFMSLLIPFEDARPPGYVFAMLIQMYIILYNCFLIFAFDSNVIALMSFFKGHLTILKVKCRIIFDVVNDEKLTREVVIERIKECHRHFNSLLELKNLYNSLVSPIMFFYALISSVILCSTVVQFSLDQTIGLPEKLFLFSYSFSNVAQLFVYCWHCTTVTFESEELDRGVYESKWWRADVRTRKDLLLLGGQLSKSFIFDAGPFAVISVTTFISILRATYSFYTFLTKK